MSQSKLQKTRWPGIFKREGERGTTYRVVAYVGLKKNGSREQKWHCGFRTLRDARAAQIKIQDAVSNNAYVAPTKLTLRKWIEDEWLDGVKPSLRPSTFESYSGNMRRHVLADHVLGPIQLQQITPGMLNRLYAKLAAPHVVDGEQRPGLSPQSVRYVHTILRRVLAGAVAEDRLTRNPADRATPPKLSAARSPEMKTWTAPELRAFLDHVKDDRLFAAYRLVAMTGLRRGELLGLRWRDVDLDGDPCRIRIVQTLIGARKTSKPKTNSSRRSVDLDPVTAQALRTHRAQLAEEQLALGPAYDAQDLVVCREDGTPAWPKTLSRSFDKHVKNAGLPRIRFHDLRHTSATLLLASGVSPKVVQERLGHSNISVTLNVYAHVTPSMASEATARAAALVDDA